MTDHQTLKREHNKLKANFEAAKVRIERLVAVIADQQANLASKDEEIDRLKVWVSSYEEQLVRYDEKLTAAEAALRVAEPIP